MKVNSNGVLGGGRTSGSDRTVAGLRPTGWFEAYRRWVCCQEGKGLGRDCDLNAVADLLVGVGHKGVGALRWEWERNPGELCRHHERLRVDEVRGQPNGANKGKSEAQQGTVLEVATQDVHRVARAG